MGARVHAVFGDPRRQAELVAELESTRRPQRRSGPILLWLIEPALVAALSEGDERRRRWTVTLVDDHFYIDVDGRTVEGQVLRTEM